jgi:hypothetical protein
VIWLLIALAGLMPTGNGDIIGTARMDADRTITLDLRSVQCNGSEAMGRVTYTPGDPNYVSVLAHIGGMKPGETKPVHAWPSEPCAR